MTKSDIRFQCHVETDVKIGYAVQGCFNIIDAFSGHCTSNLKFWKFLWWKCGGVFQFQEV